MALRVVDLALPVAHVHQMGAMVGVFINGDIIG